MKYFGFLISLILALVLAIALSLPLGPVPPLGWLLDPYHGFWQNAYSEDELAVDQIKLKNLSAPVEIVYDENLVPHIFAQSEPDLFRAQGYVTAQHRLWQMEFQTRAASGRISEIVGSQALEFDRMQRRKGLAFGAEAALAFLETEDPETLSLIAAYADGVNQYIEQLSAARLPVEYKLLNYRPEQWTPFKTVLLLKYMADMLVSDRDLEYTNLLQLIGPDLMESLFPDTPQENDPIIESTKKWEFTPLPVERPDDLQYPDTALLIDPMPSPVPGVGSNNWAVSASKTRRGHPILASDPHLSLNLPSLWYAMQLTTPDYSVKGATLPGALGVIIGFNENIAWGVTNAPRDVRDWYSITFNGDKRLEYLYNNQWIQSTLRIEEIQVKGDLPYIDSVIYTHYGPVVYDKNFRSNAQNINFSLRWTAHDGSNEQRTFLDLNRGRDHGDFIRALDHFTSPAQNFAFATTTEDIAMKVQGKFPLRWKDQGKYLMDGSNPEFEWKGPIPVSHNPATLNPPRGFVSSANQNPVDPSYPYYVFDKSFEQYRNRRLNRRLEEMDRITVQEMKDLQLDNFNLHAAEALPIMLAYMDELPTAARGGDFLADLKRWDFYADADQTAQALFTIWWDHLIELAWGKWKSPGRPIVYPNDYQTTRLLKEEPGSPVFDLPETPVIETGRDLVAESFDQMVEDLQAWDDTNGALTWSNYKKTSVQHLISNFTAFGHYNLHTGGGSGILNATSERHGPSWRMVVELAEADIRAYGIYPGGQSGNPGSRFYDNMLDKWVEGEYLEFGLRKTEDEDNVLFKTSLIPD